jgi:hypothetical protein
VFLNHVNRKPVLEPMQLKHGVPRVELDDLSKTRFLVLGQASVKLLQQLPAVLPALQGIATEMKDKKKRDKALALYASIANPSFVICLSIETVTLGILNLGNVFFQGKFLNFSSYRQKLKEILLELTLQVQNNGPEAFLRQLLQEGLHEHYTLTDKHWKSMRTRTRAFVTSLCSALRKRIPQLRIVCCFDAFSPTAIKPNNQNNGIKEIASLFNYFLAKRKPQKTVQQALNQWAIFRDQFEAFRSIHKGEITDTVSVMRILLLDARYEWADILRDLCAIAVTLPFSTAIVESTFSVMRVVKNYCTSGMSARLLDGIMQICMNGPPEMPVEKSEEIAALWLSIVARRFTTDNKPDITQRPWPLRPEDVSLFSAPFLSVRLLFFFLSYLPSHPFTFFLFTKSAGGFRGGGEG